MYKAIKYATVCVVNQLQGKQSTLLHIYAQICPEEVGFAQNSVWRPSPSATPIASCLLPAATSAERLQGCQSYCKPTEDTARIHSKAATGAGPPHFVLLRKSELSCKSVPKSSDLRKIRSPPLTGTAAATPDFACCSRPVCCTRSKPLSRQANRISLDFAQTCPEKFRFAQNSVTALHRACRCHWR